MIMMSFLPRAVYKNICAPRISTLPACAALRILCVLISLLAHTYAIYRLVQLWEVKHGSLIANPLRDLPAPPVVKLGPEFTDLEEYSRRIPFIPDMLYLGELDFELVWVFLARCSLSLSL